MLAPARALLLACVLASASCANLTVTPTDEHSGTFESGAMAFTFLGKDFPQSAVLLARANAADSQLQNLVVTEERIFPYFWRLDFLLDVISVRWAWISGTYGPAE